MHFDSVELLEIGCLCAGLGDASSSVSSSQEIDVEDMTHAAASASALNSGGGGCGAPVAQDSLAPLRRRRASMQDALDFTKINASLYERPVSCLPHSTDPIIHFPINTNTQT